MSKELKKITEEYQVDSEPEAKELIEEIKQDLNHEGYEVKSYSTVIKEKKKEGEVIDSWVNVKIVKAW